MKHTQQSVRLAFKQLSSKDQLNVVLDFISEYAYTCMFENDQLLAKFEEKKIRLSPILNSENRVLYWTAGCVKVSTGARVNYVANQAEGPTPKTAIENLLASRLTIKNSKLTKLGKSRDKIRGRT